MSKPLIAGQFLKLQGVVHGLTGGTGSMVGSFRKLDGMVGKARQGKVVGDRNSIVRTLRMTRNSDGSINPIE